VFFYFLFCILYWSSEVIVIYHYKIYFIARNLKTSLIQHIKLNCSQDIIIFWKWDNKWVLLLIALHYTAFIWVSEWG